MNAAPSREFQTSAGPPARRSTGPIVIDAARRDLSCRCLVFLVRTTHHDLQCVIGRGRCNVFASSHGPRIRTSRSSRTVKITGMALGWIGLQWHSAMLSESRRRYVQRASTLPLAIGPRHGRRFVRPLGANERNCRAPISAVRPEKPDWLPRPAGASSTCRLRATPP